MMKSIKNENTGNRKAQSLKLKNSENQLCRFKFFNFTFYILGFCFLSLLSSCATQDQAIQQKPDANIKEIQVTGGFSEAMQAAEDVLSQMNFEIDKSDYNLGYIRTRALSGGQLFELWRTENVGMENNLLSNLHSIRRVVEVNINEEEQKLDIDCNVRVQRISIPQREITSSARAYQLFTRSSLYFQRLKLNPEQEKDMVWLDLDNDLKLETEILKRISSEIEEEHKKVSAKS